MILPYLADPPAGNWHNWWLFPFAAVLLIVSLIFAANSCDPEHDHSLDHFGDPIKKPFGMPKY